MQQIRWPVGLVMAVLALILIATLPLFVGPDPGQEPASKESNNSLPSCTDWPEPPFEPAPNTDHLFVASNGFFNGPTDPMNPPAPGTEPYRYLEYNLDVIATGIYDKAFFERLSQDYHGGALRIVIGLQGFDTIGRFTVIEDQGELYPYIVLSHVYLANITSWQNELEFQIVLVHEFEHWEQYNAATTEEERDLFIEWEDGRVPDYTDSECAHLWRHEEEAYRAGCVYALKAGTERPEENICHRVDAPDAFRYSLYHIMTENKEEPHPCTEAWSQIAGCQL